MNNDNVKSVMEYFNTTKPNNVCEKSKILDKTKSSNSVVYIDAFAVYKKKEKS